MLRVLPKLTLQQVLDWNQRYVQDLCIFHTKVLWKIQKDTDKCSFGNEMDNLPFDSTVYNELFDKLKFF